MYNPTAVLISTGATDNSQNKQKPVLKTQSSCDQTIHSFAFPENMLSEANKASSTDSVGVNLQREKGQAENL